MADGSEFDGGTAGGSARREAARRRATREKGVHERHPRTARFRLALQDTPQHERSWDRGGAGEESVQESLAKRCRDGVFVLHDRRIPKSRANIDHIAVAPSGVWVIDTKRYKGKVAVRKPLFGEAKLTIDGRDRSKLMDGLDKQVSLVRDAVETLAPGVPVHGALCIVDADLPLIGTLTFRGYPLLWRKALAKYLNAGGPLDASRARELAEKLAERFPPA